MKKIILFLLLISSLLQAGDKPYLLLISLDGFRWDYLNRGLTPNMNSMAGQGTRALSLQPVFPSKTFPNHYSIVTGMYPEHHGIIYNRFLNPQSGAEYRVGDSISVRDDRWYGGETIWATAQRQGMKTACAFWPGSETHDPVKHPTYFYNYDGSVTHDQRLDWVIGWFSLPEAERPQVVTLYFSDTDDSGHRYGPDAVGNNDVIQRLDQTIGRLWQRLKQLEIYPNLNIVIVSDHGMTSMAEVQSILLSEILAGLEYTVSGYGPLVQFFPVDKQNEAELYARLKENEQGYTIYRKAEMPAGLHYSEHPFIGSLLAVADPPFTFTTSESENNESALGDHGYNPWLLDMHGILIGFGSGFNRMETGTVQNIDLYPLMCALLGLEPNPGIDGRLERVEFLIRNKK